MKKIILTVLVITLVFAASLSANGVQENDGTYKQGTGEGSGQGLRDGSGAGRGNGGGQGRNSSGTTYKENFAGDLAEAYGIEPGSGILTDSETDGLLLMVEEEKLAHDVYLALYEKWNIPVFKNIGESEQQHMDAVQLLMDAYNVDAPAETAVAGKFSNSELQNHYNELTAAGSESLEEALRVGAIIEDLDIADLQKLLADAENDEVKVLYQNLMKGSRNHMRSFTAQLARYDESYDPIYISDEYYETIMKYNRETAPITDPDYSIE